MNPPDPSDYSARLHGLDPGRIMDLGLDRDAGRGELHRVPAVDELAPLLPEYEIEGIAGRGGMGAVYRAVQRKLARTVAIKVLPVELGDTPGFADRFRREAMTTAGLVHPGIVTVYDAGETVAGHLYYVMDFVDGEDLAVRMERSRLSLEDSVALLAAVCEAVQAAHAKGIIHRDIKPSNILLTKDGQPKLADFGLALLTEKHLEYSRLTLGGTTLGTLEYSAPEQLAGLGASAASDQYSLGVLAYELLTGELPRGVFDAPSVRNAEIDPAFDGVVLRALQSDPSRRYESVEDFRAAILQAADRRMQQARRDAEARKRLRKRTQIAGAAALVALLTIGLALFAWKQSRRAEAGETEANERRSAAEVAEKETDGVIQFLLTDLRKSLEKTGNLAAMESVLERAVVHFLAKYENSGHSPGAAVRLADALVVKADVLAVRAFPDEALALYGEARKLAEEARDKEPGDPARQWRVVQAWKRLDEHYLSVGQYEKSLEHAQRMLREAELLRSSDGPKAVALAHRDIANALGYLLRLDECRDEYLKARDLFAAELKLHPESKSLAADHASIDMSLGSLAEVKKDYPLMLQHFSDWYDFVKRNHKSDTKMYAHAAFRLALALVYNNRATESIPLFGESIHQAEADVADLPGHRGNQKELKLFMEGFVKAQLQRGEGASAAEMQRRVEAVDAAIAAAPEDDAAAPRDRVADRFRRAEELLFSKLKDKPEDDSGQYAWAMASEDLGKHLETTLGTDAAARHYRQQLAKVEPLLAAAPDGSWWLLGASYALNRLGVLKEGAHAWADAEPIFRRSLEYRRQIRVAHPGNSRECRNIASTASRLARCFINLQRPKEASALWQELMAELKPIPGDSRFAWRVLVSDSIPETLATLEPDDARALVAATREFLLAHGEAALTAAEKASLGVLEKSVPK